MTGMMDFAYAVLGLVILVLAGDALVRGAVNFSLRLGVPAFIVSLTIVAIGTSAPELLVGISAVIDGAPGIAIGNVVGSNTANIFLVLGLPAMLAGLQTGACDTKTSYLQMLVATVLFVVIAATGQINFWSGMVLLAGFFLIVGHAVHVARCHRAERKNGNGSAEIEGAELDIGWGKILLLLGLGIVGLPLGAEVLVSSATGIARQYDVPETVIGLTLVAVGTSLPELATTISAAYRRQAEVALGNVIGSNMANLLGIMGVSALFGTIPVSPEMFRFDIAVMSLSALLIAPFVFTRLDMGRWWGVTFVAGYGLYLFGVLQ